MFFEKYRPRDPDQFFGDAADVAQSLAAWPLEAGENACFLLSGPSGCGKTSAARLFLARAGVHPGWGVLALNCASTTGAAGREFADSLAEWYRLAPFCGRGKAVLLEEAHRLTRATQETLNELLEDVNAHYRYRYTLACTTSPQAILPALESRFHHLRIEPPSREDVIALIRDVAGREGIDLDVPQAAKLAERALQKSPGDAFGAYNLRCAVNLVGRLVVSLSRESLAVA